MPPSRSSDPHFGHDAHSISEPCIPQCSLYDDEDMAFLHASKGLPYTSRQWEAEVLRLEWALDDARRRLLSSHHTGVCRAARFDT